jgi:hypothetical protein
MANNTGVIIAVSGISILLIGGIGLAVYSSSSKKAAEEKAIADAKEKAAEEKAKLAEERQLILIQQLQEKNAGGGVGTPINTRSGSGTNVWDVLINTLPSALDLFKKKTFVSNGSPKNNFA